ncbi:MAG: hypothetical protein EOO13_18315, partial [Chitinophagaceae bacterium]
MHKSLLLILLILCMQQGSAQDSTRFPLHFIGHWKGSLQWTQPGREPKNFQMQLKVTETDSIGIYAWTIIYGGGDSSQDLRPYSLKAIDVQSGHWVIDEGNGIVLDNYVAGNCLQGSFTVMKNTIVNNYCIENGKMRVEFFTIKLSDKKSSGKGTTDSPTVDS